jgi:hypothetical protein
MALVSQLLERLRQEDHLRPAFKDNPGNMVRPFLKEKKGKEKKPFIR